MTPTRQVSVGEWIHVPVPKDPWPVSMRIGDGPSQPAFIDHVMVGGRVKTFVSKRCPDLPPGTYMVKVQTPDGEVRTKIRIVG